MSKELKELVSSRRQYAGFMVGTVVVLVLRDSTVMFIALAVYVVMWSLVLYALSVDIKVVRDMDDTDGKVAMDDVDEK
jgi:hypothetical protein